MKKVREYASFWGSAQELTEAATHCARVLQIDGERLNERLIRYYTGEGVISKPDRLGREAAYHYRHLLQLLAARRLAQAGAPLTAARAFNVGATNDELESGLSEDLPRFVERALAKLKSAPPQPEQPQVTAGLAQPSEITSIHKRLDDLASMVESLRRGHETQLMHLEHLEEAGKYTTENQRSLGDRLMERVERLGYEVAESREITLRVILENTRATRALIDRLDEIARLGQK